jgi:hypothetical protein
MAGCQVTTGPSLAYFGDSSVPASDAGATGASSNEASTTDGASTTAADPQPGAEGGAAACPAVRPQSCPASGAACTQIGANCSYGDWCCTCGAGMMQWYCSQTDAVEPCPPGLPEAGAPCNLDAVGCTYCTPQGLLRVECSHEQFVFFPPQCETTLPPPMNPDPDDGGAARD